MNAPSPSQLDLNVVRSTLESLSQLSDAQLQGLQYATQFQEAVQAIANDVRDQHHIEESARARLRVTHFTSLDALFSMLNSDEPRLRLYDTVHLNDPREGVASEEGKSLAKSLSTATASSDTDGGISRFGTGYILSFLANGPGSDEPGDDLIFWRLYGHDGRGCSITFAPFLKPWPDSVRNDLRRVHYDPKNVPDFSAEILGLLRLLDRFQHLGSLESSAQQKLSQTLRLLDECLARRFLVKEPPYGREDEVRLVRFADSSVGEPSVELVRGAIRHYLNDDDLKLQQLTDSRTVLRLGPAVPYPEDAKRALRRLWNKTSLPHIQIETSKIEYRPSR